jgi:hypothetical protein
LLFIKHLLITLGVVGAPLVTLAQKPEPITHYQLKFFKYDSVHVYYNERYYVIQDTCADIVRQVHISSTTKRFFGPFTDFSKANQEQIVAVGSYDKRGLKQGAFKTWYLDGKLQSRGSFKDGNFDEVWDFYYPNGKPKVTFEPFGAEMKIINAWNENGRKTVENGEGHYDWVMGGITWKGKINGGRPNGKWIAATSYFRQNEALATELFKDGVFQQGSNKAGAYSDSSNIHFFPGDLLPLYRSDDLIASVSDCYALNIVAASYPQGGQQFISQIGERLTPVLDQLNLGTLNEPIVLQMKILTDGRLLFDPADGTDPKIISACTVALNALPAFTPASVNRKLVEQQMLIIIRRNSSVYTFNYALLPVRLN